MTNNVTYGYCHETFHDHYVGDYHDQCHDHTHNHFYPNCSPVTPDGTIVERPTVTSRALLGTEITLVSAEGETFVLELHEGDTINNLRYLDTDGIEYSISGYLKAIRHNISSRVVTESCIHDADTTFSTRVSTTTLVIDCSRENKSDIRLVPIKNIIGFESNTLADNLSIDGVKLLGINELSFICSEKPVAVIWNGHGVPFETRDANPDIYYVDIDTMKKNNVLKVITATSMVTISDIPTIYPYACPTEEMEPEIAKAMGIMMTTDYSVSEDSGEVTPDNIHSLMVCIAKNVGHLDELIVNDTVLRKEGSSIINVKGVPISMDNFNIDALGNLYLPVPLIFHLIDTTSGTLNLTLGEFDLVSTPPVTVTALSLASTSIVNGTSESNTVETDFENDTITLTRYDSTAGIGINLKTVDDQDIPDNTAVFANISMMVNDNDGIDNKFVYLTTAGNDITLVHDTTDDTTGITKTTFKVILVVPNYGIGCVTVVINSEVPPIEESETESDSESESI